MEISLNAFDELCNKISKDIDLKETRSRARTEQEQIRFNYAVRHLLIDLWKKHHTHEDNESSIQKNKNFYSALTKYRDPNLTYRMAIQAFEGLQKLDMIYVTKEGYYDRNKLEGSLTRYKATHNLREHFRDLEGHPAITLKPNLDIQTILLRSKVNGQRVLVSYQEETNTEKWRKNIRTINECFAKHLLDIRLKNSEISIYYYFILILLGICLIFLISNIKNKYE